MISGFARRALAQRAVNGFTLVIGAVALASLISQYGFHLRPEVHKAAQILDFILVLSFAAQNIVRWRVSGDRRSHAHGHSLDLILTGMVIVGFPTLIVADGLRISTDVFDYFLGKTVEPPGGLAGVYVRFFDFYLMTLVSLSFARMSHRVFRARFLPATGVMVSFITVIGVGALLLMLPRATMDDVAISPIDALFTATSAVCVTGLIVLDTATDFSLLGQIVILVLIQVGGIGYMTLTTFFVLFLGRGGSLREYAYMRDALAAASASDVRKALARIVSWTFVFEFVGATIIFVWLTRNAPDQSHPIWLVAVFHSVSAFCNAGFALWSDSLAGESLRFSWALNLVMMTLIVLGGLGFSVIGELFERGARRKKRRLSPQSALVLAMSAMFIVVGAFGYFILERNATLNGLHWSERVLSSLFQSVTTRTAGFNTLDTSSILPPTALMMMLLMVIGGSPSGTAGGVKTTTVGIAALSAIATAQGRGKILILRRRIREETIHQALSVISFAILVVGAAIFLLTITEPRQPLLRVIFEAVSAFGTVGLSMGITSALSTGGKIVIICCMFLGRLGPLTVAIALSRRIDRANYDYPGADIAVM